MNCKGVMALILVSGSFACYAGDHAVERAKTHAAIDQFLAAEGQRCPDDPEESESDAASYTTISEVAIRGGGGTEYIVEGQFACYCSVTGNCLFWVLAPSGHTFQVLLSGVGGVEALQSVNHGRPDLMVSLVESMHSTSSRTYQFDGAHYKETKCTYTTSQDGETKETSTCR